MNRQYQMKTKKVRRRAFLLLAMLLCSGVASAQVIIKGNVYGGCELGKVQKSDTVPNSGNTSVTIGGGIVEQSIYGGGKGDEDVDTAGWVKGNTTVTMSGGIVVHSIYGGGYCGSVGNFTSYNKEYYFDGNNQKTDSINVPTACESGTGVAKVVISGGNVGKYGSQYGSLMPTEHTPSGLDDVGYVFAGSAGVADSINHPKAPAMGVVDSSYVEINDGLITASVYGGCENGLVLRNTSVKIAGGQIGTGHYLDGTTHKWDAAYDEEKWTAAITAIQDGTIATALSTAQASGGLQDYFHECDRWEFEAPYKVYDYYYGSAYTTGSHIGDTYSPLESDNLGHNGHTFFGHVFGGGSGYYPIAPGVWRYRAGQVNGNTNVEITGGHILSNVYGGNEYTDVLGKVTVTMSGGTVGIPRTTTEINECPVNGYLFGAGMGDPRTAFNTWTNVDSTNVSIDGGIVFSSVFAGGEEGHVLYNTHLTIDETDGHNKPTLIGTYGYLEFEGNVFGAGRGFTRLALTAGTIGGNSRIDIKGGTMLGSIYGGGSMASVGTFFTDPNSQNYGQLQPGPNHGYTTINITGGTIGNDYEAVYHPDFDNLSQGGNVFGGSKGAFTLLDSPETNPIWLDLGKVKHTAITINQDDTITNIKGNVYGGGEFGTVEESTSIGISAGTIWRDVYGGGHGSDTINTGGLSFSPLEHAGRVYGNTSITISDSAWIKKCVYGGGQIASVGKITSCTSTTLPLSWPYKFVYDSVGEAPSKTPTGETVITVTGGRIGLTGKDYFGPWNYIDNQWKPVYYDNLGNAHSYTNDSDLKNACIDNGDIYGGSKGRVVDLSVIHHMGNVRKTTVTVNIPSSHENPTTPTNYKPTTGDSGIDNTAIGHATGFYPSWSDWTTRLTNASRRCVTGAVYAGAEEGHVNEDTKVILTDGLVGHSIYGAGKGKGKDKEGHYILTDGKVYGNTEININGGYVVRSIYGGGNLASVGKGNYIGLEGGEATTNQVDSTAAANSGIATINIYGGQIGMLPIGSTPDPESVVKDNIPYGSVFGGSRGQSVGPVAGANFSDSTDFFGYVNKTVITIGDPASASLETPRLYGSVYGGGQDGHVRRNTNVTINSGEIGLEFFSTDSAMHVLGDDNCTSAYWSTRGNVFGGGSGISQYKVGGNKYYSPIAGSVYDSVKVTVNGGLIHRNVFGGGSMAFVEGHVTVDVNSPIGMESNNFKDVRDHDYGGYVFGAGRGDLSVALDTFATTGSTDVNIGGNAYVPGDVYGGGAMGQVMGNTKVSMTAGTLGTIGYDWKTTTTDHTEPLDTIVHTSGGMLFGGGKGESGQRNAALVRGNTEVTVRGGHVLYNVYGGGEMGSVGLRDTVFEGNTIKDFAPHAGTGYAHVAITGGQVGPAPQLLRKQGSSSTEFDSINIPNGLFGTDGHVFGGGKGMGNELLDSHKDYADVNYTSVKVDITGDPTNNRIWGSVFGGSEDGHVLGSDTVCFANGLLGTDGKTSYDGNIFGGGRNNSKMNYTAGRTRGNTIVEMTGGQIYGNIYGGGRNALTGISWDGPNMLDGTGHGYTKVMVKGGIVGNNTLTGTNPIDPDETVIDAFTYSSMGNVYAGGKGALDGLPAPHPVASGLLVGLTKNTEVEVSDTLGHNTHIYGIVFGGGEIANVGQYTWDLDTLKDQNNMDSVIVKNIQITEGLAKVKISGGIIGGNTAQMRYELESTVPTDDNFYLRYNDDLGYVYGGGEGWSDDPGNYPIIQDGPTTADTISLLDLMATVNNTVVTITNDTVGTNVYRPWVKASVFGGAECGHVRGNTTVTIAGGQIGAGHYEINGQIVDSLYAEAQFINPNLVAVTDQNALQGTAHWQYGKTYSGSEKVYYHPFDPVLLKSDTIPADGRSWFGNVFGGGSGWFPYQKYNTTTDKYESCWNSNAGRVWGNTEVIITGGHILNNVYGANESTDVGDYGIADATNYQTLGVKEGEMYRKSGGKATVRMSGGTVGVPRTETQIQAQPTTSFVFGGGAGDPRRIFNDKTMVDTTEVIITGGIVYGSVFGGAEMGHVLSDASVNISQPNDNDSTIIGTTGFSGYDGLVFGGGKGDETDFDPYPINNTTTPATPAHPNFACGRVGGVAKVTMSSGYVLGNLYGGGMIALTGVGINGDYAAFINGSQVYDSLNHGLAKVEVNGGFIGNKVNDGRDLLTKTEKAGNVYGGGRGKIDDYTEDDYGRAANAVVNISGSPEIYGSVFGGGQMANVGHWNNYTDRYSTKTSATLVNIEGEPTIGTALEFDHDNYAVATPLPTHTFYDTINGVRMISQTRTGNVYGGGQGDMVLRHVTVPRDTVFAFGFEQGHCGTAEIQISGNPVIRSSVYGGTEQGAVWGDTKVTIAGGTIGTMGIQSDSVQPSNQSYTHATYSFGSVFGGSFGKDSYLYLLDSTQAVADTVNAYSGRIYGDTRVEIKGGKIRGNVFGGGNFASVDGNCVVIVDAQSATDTIGPLDGTGLNAYVFGGGKGYHNDPLNLRKAYANVDSTFVAIHGGKICGSIFGGGNDSHVLGSASIKVHDGANVGTNGLTTWDGNIFGGGRNFLNTNHTSGRVEGNIKIEMIGGTLQGSIFGGGRMALSGVNESGFFPNDPVAWRPTDHGNVSINVSGGKIGNDSDEGIHLLKDCDESVGDIFGSGKGDTKNYLDTVAGRVTNSSITISGSTRINGAVFGGGEMASLGWWDGNGVFVDSTGIADITINDTPTIGTYLELNANYLENPSVWTIFDSVDGCRHVTHTCTGNVFGGCQGDVDFEDWDPNDQNTWNNWPVMGRSNKSTVTINGGTIMSHVFGGSEQGTVAGDTKVVINGGNIGTMVTDEKGKKYRFGDVYGAGYGSDEESENTMLVTAFGHQTQTDSLSGRTYGNVSVDILDGTILNNVFGGASYAFVDGAITVNIGDSIHQLVPSRRDTVLVSGNATIGNNVYGSNNLSGSPLDIVTVNIFGTAHTVADSAIHIPANVTDTAAYAIQNVFGGSNYADFNGDAAYVNIFGCENTVRRVFGGSDAAASPSVNTDIQGGRFYHVFGGGNGENYPANVNGNVSVALHGGKVEQLFIGSNQHGEISGSTTSTIDNNGPCGELDVDEFFCGGNFVDYIGDVNATISCSQGENMHFRNLYGGCNQADVLPKGDPNSSDYQPGNIHLSVYGGKFQNVYGGSKGRLADPANGIEAKPANISGSITLDIFGGEIDTVFGGSNILGNVHGTITVNVIDSAACDFMVHNVYGGGRGAEYAPDSIMVNGVKQSPISPIVNIVNGTISKRDDNFTLGNVFGGGLGSEAVVKANPKVTIGNSITHTDKAVVAGNVYGGGEAAEVKGDSHVILDGRSGVEVKGNVYGGGKGAEVNGNAKVEVK